LPQLSSVEPSTLSRVEAALAARRADRRAGHDTAAKPAKRRQRAITEREEDDPDNPEPARDEREDQAEPAAAATTEAHSAAAGIVLEISAFALVVEPHGKGPPVWLLNARRPCRLQNIRLAIGIRPL
jgi:uncharacterized membrane protein